jgi:uncharacterized NAD(P)/FAD-binding protein YdhS
VIRSDGEVDPDLYVVGAARKGVEWEVGAIPDLRGQAARLADELVRQVVPESAGADVGTGAAAATG